MRWPLFVVASALILAVLVGGISRFRERQAAAWRIEVWAKSRDQEDFATKALRSSISFDGRSITLQQFADAISRQCGFPVVVDEAAIGSYLGTEPPLPLRIELPLGTYSLWTALHFEDILSPHFCADFGEGQMLITTADASVDRNHLRTVIYPLPQPEPEGMDENDWSELIRTNVDWRQSISGGPPYVEVAPGAIVVVHSNEGHRKIRWLMDSLGRLAEKNMEGVLWPPSTANSHRKEIRKALDEKTSFAFVETPLAKAIELLAKRHRIPMILREDKLREAGVPSTTRITKNLKDISLRSLLHLILNELELTFVVQDDALIVTTPEDAESQEIIVAYPVEGIVTTFAGPPVAADWDSLAELITGSIRPDSWDFSGPAPTMGYGDRWLVLSQTENVHEQIHDLIVQLRCILAPADSSTPSLLPSERVKDEIRVALQQPITLDSKPMRLNDAVSQIQKLLKIPILLNAKKLDEAGVRPDASVVTTLGQASAREHLDSLLQQIQLTSLVRDEVLQITSPEDVESHLVTHVYDTRQILAARISDDYLRDLITSTVQPATWNGSGGPGSIDTFRQLLVVCHTPLVHDEIRRLLESLADAKSKGKRQGSVDEGSKQ